MHVASVILTKLQNAILSHLLVPLPLRLNTRIYYRLFTRLFEVITEEKGLFNCGQEYICDETIVNLTKLGHWLDVGCGIGGPACRFASLYPLVSITGINISRLQIEKSKLFIDQKGLSDRVRIRFGDACDMPFDNDSLDGAYAIETAYHYPDKQQFIFESFRALRPGAKLALADMVLVEHVPDFYHRAIATMFHGWLGSVRMHKESLWRRHLQDAGFVDIQVRDVSDEVLRGKFFSDGQGESIRKQVKKWQSTLKKEYSESILLISTWVHEWQGQNPQRNAIHYVIIEARSLRLGYGECAN